MLSEKMHDVPSLSLITIKDCDAGQRIDRWLRSRYPNVSQSLLQKLIRKGNIRVNKYKIKPNYIVNIGEKIFIPLVLQESNPKKTNRTSGFISEKDQNFVKSLVIYKDDHIFALNKPHGLASQGGSGQIHHIDFLIRGLVANAEIDDCPRLVHRLDIGTSGTLLLARTRIAAQKLTELFRDHKIVKIYWACVMGKPTKVHGIISSDVAKKTSTQIMETTCYSLIKHSDIHNVSWLALYPLTGKKHQLRRHLQTLNTPIIGDKQYGFSPSPSSLLQSQKLHLHARTVLFYHPFPPHHAVKITAPLPQHMEKNWAQCQWRNGDFSEDIFMLQHADSIPKGISD